jgi:CRISPR-associated protein Csh1
VIESIYQIGCAARQGASGRRALLEALAETPPQKGDSKPKIAILKLETVEKTLDIKVHELSEDGDHTAERYLWLGNAAGANSDQDRLTTNNLAYLVSQTVPNLLNVVTVDTPLYKALSNLKSALYLDIGEQNKVGSEDKGSYRRYRYVWDLAKLNIPGATAETLKAHVRETKSAKKVPELVAAAIKKHFETQLRKDEMLYTLEVDGKLLIDDEEYHAYLERVLVSSVFEGAEMGRCHLSGQAAPVTTNMTRFKFKYYITDKQGFAAGAVPDGFRSSLTLSKDAYLSLLVGERFIRRELGFYLASTSGYILPDFHTQTMSREFISDLENELRRVKNRAALNMGLQLSVDDLMYAEAGQESGYMLNLLFYKQSKANFKVLRLIRDVPDYRLGELRSQAQATKRLGDARYGESNQWLLTLQRMYYLLPVRKSRTDTLSKGVLEFYDTLISGGLIERVQLIEQCMELTRVYRFGNYAAYHISEPKDADYALAVHNAQSNLLLAFLRNQAQLKEGNVDLSYLDELVLDEPQREYLKRLRYTREQTALYLLGVLIGEIANAQYRLGPGGKGGKKTILNKLNYQGMTLPRVQRLATEVFDKLRQYRDSKRRPLLQARTEKFFAQAQQLLSEGEASGAWPLTPAENVYYLLSGYSHTTLQAINAGTVSDPDTTETDEAEMEGATA